ncbi:MAG: hypothetical protein JO157_15065 [Acetobacteraceae bacterium]|nr:hypothetical protein [Acetobacteraceae bacterium]
MLYSVYATFKPDAEERRDELHEQFNQHLMQRFIHIRVAGPMFDEDRRRTGILLLIEADDIEKVRHFVRISPYTEANLYDTIEIRELDVQVGRLG